ncbi:MAG: glycosyl hydrolase family 28-related protein [Planctomycetota bacterium]|jgi:hypothetical protein|nr:glycosyl hydrolase family 28-related protein [Planctomycetota bacterium]
MRTFILVTLLSVLMHAEDIRFPDDAGVIDVTQAPYGAVGDGVSDCTAAIQKALADNVSGNRIIYFPNGIYLVSDTLRWGSRKDGKGKTESGSAWKRTIFQGQSRDGVVLKLADGTAGFGDAAAPKSVIWTGLKPAQRFRNSVRNLSVDVGNNPGAIAIQYNTSNQGTLHHVTVRGQGAIGLDLSYTNEIGPLLALDCVVEGFATGVKIGGTVNSMTFDGLELRGQSRVGMETQSQVVTIRGLRSVNSVPALISYSGVVTLLEADCSGGAADAAAVVNAGAMFVRDMAVAGYAHAIRHQPKEGDEQLVAGPVTEWTDTAPFQLFDGKAVSLRLPIEDCPILPYGPLETWANPLTFGAMGDGKNDDTAAIQQAIDSGARTVYLPAGKSFLVLGEVELRGALERVIGCESRIKGDGTFVLVDGAPETVVVERIECEGGFGLVHRAKRNLAVRNMMIGRIIGEGTGKLFVDDVSNHNHGQIKHLPMSILRLTNPRIRCWARQVNPEPTTGPKILVQGATLWLLGYKTESSNTTLFVDGGKVEVLGAHVYAQGPVKQLPCVVIRDGGQVSLAGFRQYSFKNTMFEDFIEETRGSKTRMLPRGQASGHGLVNWVSLFVAESRDQAGRAGEVRDQPSQISWRLQGKPLSVDATTGAVAASGVRKVSLPVAADASIRKQEAQANNGGGARLALKSTDYSCNKIYLQFDLSRRGDRAVTAAELVLQVANDKLDADENINVFVLGNGAKPWDEASINWDNAPGNNLESKGGPYAVDKHWRGGVIHKQAYFAGTMTVRTQDAGRAVRFGSARLAQVVDEDFDGQVTVVLTGHDSAKDNNLVFISREGGTAPTLDLALEKR